MAHIIAPPPKLYAPEKVDAVAAEMQRNDPEWTYKVKHDPKGFGYSIIEIYDEDGIFVGHA